MNRVVIIQQLAEWRMQDEARALLESTHIVQLAAELEAEHPTIPDPASWSGPCVEGAR